MELSSALYQLITMTNEDNVIKELPHLKLKSGECIFSEGEKGDFAYIIEEGVVEISTVVNGRYTILNTLKAGELFGELALVDGSPRSASASAKTDVVLTIVNDEQVKSRIDDANPVLKMLLMMVTKYFRSETGNFRSTVMDTDLPPVDVDKHEYQGKIFQAIELIRLESELRNGFKQGELKPFFQPILDLRNNVIVGFELLLRWFSAERGFVPPDVFIPLAESTSLIIPIGEWIIDEALKSLEKMTLETGYELFLSLNIAQKQINDPKFIEILKQKINNSSLKPQQIKLEILERSLFEGEIALALVESCRQFGLPLIVDDFGTGYANLAYLTQFQFDTVKIDRFFIDKLEHDNKEEIICKALIDLSRGLQMNTVAEGIETKNQLEILLNLGCEFGQGYFFSPPVCCEDAIALLQKQTQQGFFMDWNQKQ